MKKIITHKILTLNGLDSNLNMYSTEKYVNPFDTTIDFIDYYKYLATSAPIDELKAFADYEYYGKNYPKAMPREILFEFQLSELGPEEDNNVIEFNIDDILEKTKNDPFYSDFYKLNTPVPINLLTSYAIAKAELRAFKCLPEKDTEFLKFCWIGVPDILPMYISYGLDYIGAEAYKLLGYRWFCKEAHEDSVRYQYCLDAIFCAKKYYANELDKELREDLISIYGNISFSINIKQFKNNEEATKLLSNVQKAIEEWDIKQIKNCIQEIPLLKSDEKETIDNNQNIENKNTKLKEEIKNIQSDYKLKTDSNKIIDEIIDRIYTVTNLSSVESQEIYTTL